MDKKIFFIIVLLLFLIPIISSISIVSVQTQDDSLVIEYPKLFVLKQNEDYHFRFHAFNKTDGKLLTNETINCTLNLYNSSGEGIFRKENLTFGDPASSNDCLNCFNHHILGGNFSDIGFYSYLIRCQNNEIGGAVSVGIEVTPTGFSPSISSSIIYGLLLLFLIVFDIFVFYLIGGLRLQNERDENTGEVIRINLQKYLKISLIGISYGLILLTLNLMNALALSVGHLTQFSGIIGSLFEIMLRVAWVWTLCIVIWIIVATYQDSQFKKTLKQYFKDLGVSIYD